MSKVSLQIAHQSILIRPPPWAEAALTPDEAITFFRDTSSVGKPSSAAFATASASPETPAFCEAGISLTNFWAFSRADIVLLGGVERTKCPYLKIS